MVNNYTRKSEICLDVVLLQENILFLLALIGFLNKTWDALQFALPNLLDVDLEHTFVSVTCYTR